MRPELRIALLGQGFMGKAHSNAYCQAGHFYDLPYRIRRKVICGRDANALAAMADRWGWEETATDWRAVVERSDIDAVDVSLPNHLHAPAAIAAAQAGKMVLCEKPLAMDVSEARAMVDAARKVPTLVWFNYRRVPAIAFARQLIDDGRLGTIFHYDAAYRQQWGADLSRAATWRMDPALAGSGVADDLLTHLLDTALYLNGPMTEGIAVNKTFAPGRKVDDAMLAIVKFENGSLGTFEATRFGIGVKNGNAFQLHGSGGMLRFNLERLNHLEFVDATNPSTEQGPRDLLVTDLKHPIFPNFWRPGHIIGYEHTFIAALAEFLNAVAKGERFRPDFADGLAVQQALHALQESAATRQWTSIVE
jgi:predicted dehydrogenase